MVQSLKAGKFIVGAFSVMIDPTGIAATTLAIDTVQTIKNWYTGTADLTKIARAFDKQFQQNLKSPRFDKPADARVLQP